MADKSDFDLAENDLKDWLISGLNLTSEHIHYPVINETAMITDVKGGMSTGMIWIWLVIFIVSIIILRWFCLFIGRCCCCCSTCPSFFCCRRRGYEPIPPPSYLKVETRQFTQKGGGAILPVAISVHSTQQKQAPPTPPHFTVPISGISKVTEKRLAEKAEKAEKTEQAHNTEKQQQQQQASAKKETWRR